MELIRWTVMAVAVLGLVIGGVSATSQLEQADSEATELSPGERLSGILGIEHAEWRGEIDYRAFENEFERADGSSGQAAVLDERLARIEEQLATLAARRAELEDVRAEGELSEGAYRAQLARIDVERRQAERALNQSGRVAAGLPNDVLEEQGVEVEAIDRLRDSARNMTGGEVAEIARGIAGPGDKGAPGDIPNNRSADPPGPPDDRPGRDGE